MRQAPAAQTAPAENEAPVTPQAAPVIQQAPTTQEPPTWNEAPVTPEGAPATQQPAQPPPVVNEAPVTPQVAPAAQQPPAAESPPVVKEAPVTPQAAPAAQQPPAAQSPPVVNEAPVAPEPPVVKEAPVPPQGVPATQETPAPVTTAVPTTPAPVANVYEHATAGHLSEAVAGALERVYVPNVSSEDVYVIDPATMKVVDRYKVGRGPQHIVPAWDLKTLWVTGSAKSHAVWGSLAAIDPQTGKLIRVLPMEDAYNMYFTPDGASAIVVAESRRRLEYRDPHTMKLQSSLTIPACSGINHADFSADGRYAVFTCEFAGALVKIDVAARKVLGFLKLNKGGMPQDVRISPDGKLFYVANMMTDGVSLIDGESFTEVGFIPTGVGTHGLYPSRDGKKLYVSNRGSNAVSGPPHGKGSVSVIDFATQKVEATWPVPGGGSPDMGNVSADGRHLWLSGRFDNVVYAIDTITGQFTTIPVGRTPHGLTIWPQPGRYSLGHTGVMR